MLAKTFKTLSLQQHMRCAFSQIYKNDLTDSTYETTAGFCKPKNETNAKNRFVGKVGVVTGAVGNFGRKCAERLASEGANLVIADLAGTEKVAKELSAQYGVKVIGYDVDQTKENDVNTVFEDIKKQYGQIDLLFNNAGYQGEFVQLHQYPVADFRKVIYINVTGAFIWLQAAANMMINQKNQGGSIVNTASMAAHSGPPNMVAYGTSKAAVLHMTKIASKDLSCFNIRVNSVSPAFIGPGFMWTRQIEKQAAVGSMYYDSDPKKVAEAMIGTPPLRRYGSIEEVIGPVTFFLSDDASYLTGVDIEVTGGMN